MRKVRDPAVLALLVLAPWALLSCKQGSSPDKSQERDHAAALQTDAPRQEGDRRSGAANDQGTDMMGGAPMGMMRDGGMMGDMMRDMPGWMMSGDMRMDRRMMRDMHVIHDLLINHEKIDRKVEDIPGGVRTLTTSRDAQVARAIRAHVHQMKGRVEDGRPIRHMDPLFREIFEHHDKIEMQVEDVPGGVQVTETSKDPQVAALIRQHARKAVSEFVTGGMRRAMRPTPLPEGYQPER